ncbi:MAG: hypothetical protein ABW186_13160 [Rhodanobacteraceae bacterium]
MFARKVVPVAAAALLIAACSDKSSAPSAAPAGPTAAQQQANAQAAKSIAMYRDLLQSKSYELAGPIGQEIVDKYPGTTEAKEVQVTLADTVAKGHAMTTRRRLERLWIYQTGKESGGDQTTASIYDTGPSINDRVRLVLRRHSAWGQSVYLFADGSKGFECRSPCTITAHFDNAPAVRIKAHLPETGEPAIFVSDDRDFIARMDKAEKIVLDVTIRGRGAQSLTYEVGGYQTEKFGTPLKK